MNELMMQIFCGSGLQYYLGIISSLASADSMKTVDIFTTNFSWQKNKQFQYQWRKEIKDREVGVRLSPACQSSKKYLSTYSRELMID